MESARESLDASKFSGVDGGEDDKEAEAIDVDGEDGSKERPTDDILGLPTKGFFLGLPLPRLIAFSEGVGFGFLEPGGLPLFRGACGTSTGALFICIMLLDIMEGFNTFPLTSIESIDSISSSKMKTSFGLDGLPLFLFTTSIL